MCFRGSSETDPRADAEPEVHLNPDVVAELKGAETEQELLNGTRW